MTRLWAPKAMREPPRLDPDFWPSSVHPRHALLVNPFYPKDPHASFGTFDYVLANPPFNVDDVSLSSVEKDKRFNAFGIPRNKSKAKRADAGKELNGFSAAERDYAVTVTIGLGDNFGAAETHAIEAVETAIRSGPHDAFLVTEQRAHFEALQKLEAGTKSPAA